MPIEIKGLCPLLQVFDMPTSVAFYCGVLGFEVKGKSHPGPEFYWCLLHREGIELMLNTAYDEGERPATPDPARVAAHSDSAIYFGAPDVDAVYEYLRAKGLQVAKPRVAPYGMKQLYLNDPDGYELCFQWPEKKD